MSTEEPPCGVLINHYYYYYYYYYYYILLNRNKCRGEFSHSEHLVFVRKNSPEKKKRHNNIKSERKLREKHLFCASLTEKVNWYHNPLHSKSLRSKST